MWPPTLPTWTPAAGKLTDVALDTEKSGAVCTARLVQTSTIESMASSVISLRLGAVRLLMTWHDPIRKRCAPWLETMTDFGLWR